MLNYNYKVSIRIINYHNDHHNFSIIAIITKMKIDRQAEL
jgi:hypothetical protein